MTREEAIYELKNAAWLGTEHSRARTEEALDMAIKALSQEPKWIPVSERLPKMGDYVLCSVKDGMSRHRIIISSFLSEFFWDDGTIEAWMPLPKPYEPQESEDKE